MHTTVLHDSWIAIHNGDFSGNVTLRKFDELCEKVIAEIEVPVTVIEELVAEKIRGERIAELEQATTAELLRGRPT
jgi:hydroxymethylglutaryl-CoA reductase